MTDKKHKLAPVVPTDEMQDSFNEEDCVECQWNGDDGYDPYVHPDSWDKAYTAMLKDTPTLVEVDLDKYIKDFFIGIKLCPTYKSGIDRCVEIIKKKHGKIYAVKGE